MKWIERFEKQNHKFFLEMYFFFYTFFFKNRDVNEFVCVQINSILSRLHHHHKKADEIKTKKHYVCREIEGNSLSVLCNGGKHLSIWWLNMYRIDEGIQGCHDDGEHPSPAARGTGAKANLNGHTFRENRIDFRPGKKREREENCQGQRVKRCWISKELN